MRLVLSALSAVLGLLILFLFALALKENGDLTRLGVITALLLAAAFVRLVLDLSGKSALTEYLSRRLRKKTDRYADCSARLDKTLNTAPLELTAHKEEYTRVTRKLERIAVKTALKEGLARSGIVLGVVLAAVLGGILIT